MAKVANLGHAKTHSRMFKRGYLVNLIPNKGTAKPAEKPEEKPSEKKGSSSGSFPFTLYLLPSFITLGFHGACVRKT